MDHQYTILVADRNSRVRNFLRRELMAEGYRIQLAQNGREVLKMTYTPEPLDLIILDPDLPDMDEMSLFRQLRDRIPTLPLVIHAFLPDPVRDALASGGVAFVEKRGNSIENLKTVVKEILLESKGWAAQSPTTRKKK